MGFVVLLKGINVGGANRLPMADLRKICVGLGWQHVETYLASGNVVFDADAPPESLAADLRTALAGQGLDVPVLVLDSDTIRRASADCPFALDDPRQVHVCFALGLLAVDRGLFDTRKAPGDELETGDGLAWLHTPGGFGKSALSSRLDALLGCDVTARNLRSVAKLAAMLDARG